MPSADSKAPNEAALGVWRVAFGARRSSSAFALVGARDDAAAYRVELTFNRPSELRGTGDVRMSRTIHRTMLLTVPVARTRAHGRDFLTG